VRRWTRLGVSVLLLPTLWLGACSDDEAVTPDDDGKGGSGGQVIPEFDKVDLVVDTNRDGVLNGLDNEGEALWTVERGAAFLPNLDDDNGDGILDAENDWIDLTEEHDLDLHDLAKMHVAPWPEVPATAVGRIFLDGMALPHVRVFKRALDGNWYMVLGIDMADPPNVMHVHELTAAEIAAGVDLAVEGRTLAGLHNAVSWDGNENVPWSGIASFSYGVWETPDAPGPMIVDESNPGGMDEVQMRVAPWIMYGNLTPYLDLVFANNTGFSNQLFRDVIQQSADEDDRGVHFWVINNWNDRWTEDWMQTGFVSMPAADGAVHGIRLTMPRPFSQGGVQAPPIEWLRGNLTFQDSGYFATYKTVNTGSTLDSHGNHDLVPAYGGFPYGRIIYGSGILPETAAFYEAQLVQTPAVTVPTGWLYVKHVDEVFSYVPANTERGWKLLVGSPALARTMLETWRDQGHGEQQLFIGKKWWNNTNAAISINDLLADTDIMSWSQQSQGHIDGMLATLVAELALQPDEILEIPFLFERDSGGMVAYNPGTVNSLVFNNSIVIPDPFGPNINGVDGFQKDLIDRLGTAAHGIGRDGTGMKVYFADNWEAYHINLGEVHCGTNISGPPSPEIKWWEAMQ
jgi:protein-arginine deiminase